MHQNKPQGLRHSLWSHFGEGNRGPSDGIPSKKTKLLLTLNVCMNIEPFTSRFSWFLHLTADFTFTLVHLSTSSYEMSMEG